MKRLPTVTTIRNTRFAHTRLSGIHALDNITVNDILVPRSDVDGINLDDSIEEIIEQLRHNKRTRLPVFHSDINQVEAVLNTRQIRHLLNDGSLTREALLAASYEPYFVPESTPLQLQLLNFHKQQRRLGMVVDEYGEVLGIVTLEDILEEIVGEFESEHSLDNPHIHPQADGRMVIDGTASIRELNKMPGLAFAERWAEDAERSGDRGAGDDSGERGLLEDRTLSPGDSRDRGEPGEQGVDLAYEPGAGQGLKLFWRGRLRPRHRITGLQIAVIFYPSCLIVSPLPIIKPLTQAPPNLVLTPHPNRFRPFPLHSGDCSYLKQRPRLIPHPWVLDHNNSLQWSS